MSQPFYQQNYNNHQYYPPPTNHGQPAAGGYQQPAGGYQQPPYYAAGYPHPQQSIQYHQQHHYGYMAPPPAAYGAVPPPSLYGAIPPVPQGGAHYYEGAPQQRRGGYQPILEDPPPPDRIYYDYAAQRLEEDGQPVEEMPFPDVSDANVRVVPKPDEVIVKTYLNKAICLCVTSFVLLMLPVIPIALCALAYSLCARNLQGKRNYDEANKKGSSASCCLWASIPFTIGWVCLIVVGTPIVTFFFLLNKIPY